MIYLGKSLDAEGAKQHGIVTEVLKSSKFHVELLAEAQKLSSSVQVSKLTPSCPYVSVVYVGHATRHKGWPMVEQFVLFPLCRFPIVSTLVINGAGAPLKYETVVEACETTELIGSTHTQRTTRIVVGHD
jgi:enoyl-CoA hydratase/carnithine racemase